MTRRKTSGLGILNGRSQLCRRSSDVSTLPRDFTSGDQYRLSKPPITGCESSLQRREYRLKVGRRSSLEVDVEADEFGNTATVDVVNNNRLESGMTPLTQH